MKRVRSWLWQSTGELPAFTAGYNEKYVEALLCGLGRNLSPPWRLELWVDETWHTLLESWLETHPQFAGLLELVRFKGPSCGGWSRMMEIYAPERAPSDEYERVLAVGLDTILTANCDWLFDWNLEPIGFIRDPLVPSTISNSVMTFDSYGAKLLWESHLEALANRYQDSQIFGQPSEMILMRKWWELGGPPLAPRCLEEKPERIISYKVHLKTLEDLMKSCIIYFHGSPKPHELPRGNPLRHLWDALS